MLRKCLQARVSVICEWEPKIFRPNFLVQFESLPVPSNCNPGHTAYGDLSRSDLVKNRIVSQWILQ